MKRILKSCATGLATVLATTAILASCSKEKKTLPPELEAHSTEITIYVTEQNKVFGGTAKYF